jgi:hypothetical protein
MDLVRPPGATRSPSNTSTSKAAQPNSPSINNHPIATWLADASLPSIRPNGDNSTRRTIPGVTLNPGDTIRIEGTPDGADPAALDYIEITPVQPEPAAGTAN